MINSKVSMVKKIKFVVLMINLIIWMIIFMAQQINSVSKKINYMV